MSSKIISATLMFGMAICISNTSFGQSRSSANISRIFSYDMLRLPVADLERIIGAPHRVGRRSGGLGQWRDYHVGGCELSALNINGGIDAYRLKLSASCTFDLTRLIRTNRSPLQAHGSTFGTMANILGGRFLPTCLAGCQNSAERQPSMFFDTSRADGNIEVIASTLDSGSQVAEARMKLLAAALQIMPDRDILSGRVVCHPEYEDLALAAFRNVRISEITIGFSIEPNGNNCS